jgi:hypothetical protein
MKRVQKQKEEEYKELPLNKDYLTKVDEKGQPVFETSKLLFDYLIDQHKEKSLDGMRNTLAFINNISFRKDMIFNYEMELKKGITSKNPNTGNLLRESEIKSKIFAEKVGIYRDLSDARSNLVSLLQHIGVSITAEEYDKFVKLCIKETKSIGHDLFPKEIDLLKL